jgi:hypothetical protein
LVGIGIKVDKFMAKRIILFSFLLLTAVGLFGQDFPAREPVLVKIFPVGKEDGSFGGIPVSKDVYGPTAFCFDSEGFLVVVDTNNKRICTFDNNYNFISSINNSPIIEPSSLEIDDEGNVIGYFGSSGVQKMDKYGNEVFFIYVLGDDISHVIRGDGFYIANNMVFAYNRFDCGIIGFKDPGTDYKENNRNVLDTQEVIREIERNHPSLRVETGIEPSIQQRDSTSRPTVPSRQSSEYVIYENGVELSRDFDNFFESKEQQGALQSKSFAGDSQYSLLLEKYSHHRFGQTLFGTDTDGNTYWQFHHGIFVFNPQGVIIAAFTLESLRRTTHPVISPSGDVYYMGSGKTGHYLYKYERDW